MAAMIATELRWLMSRLWSELVVLNVVNWRQSAAATGRSGKAQIELVARADRRLA
jgi:hypothetical protein